MIAAVPFYAVLTQTFDFLFESNVGPAFSRFADYFKVYDNILPVSEYRTTKSKEGEIVFELKLAAADVSFTEIPVPDIPHLAFYIGPELTGNDRILALLLGYRADVLSYVEVKKLQFAVRLKTPFLRGVDRGAEIKYTGGIRIYTDKTVVLTADEGLTLNECELLRTGITISFKNIQFDFYENYSTPQIVELGYDETFRGFYAEEGTIKVLPQSIFNNKKGIQLQLHNAAVSENGVSFKGNAFFDVVLKPDGTDIESADLTGSILGCSLTLGSVGIEVHENFPLYFDAAGFIRLPIFGGLLFKVNFGLLPVSTTDFQTTVAVSALRTMVLPGFNGSNLVEIGTLNVNGILKEDKWDLEGQVADVHLRLPGVGSIDLQQANLKMVISPRVTSFALHVRHIAIGVLGQAERAEFSFFHNTEVTAGSSIGLKVLATMKLSDLRTKLPAIEPRFEKLVPIDDIEVAAFLEWQRVEEGGTSFVNIHIKLEMAVDDPVQFWEVFHLPPALRTEVDNIKLAFDIHYKEGEEDSAISNGKFKGDFALQADIKLPEVPEVLEGVSVSTGDQSGWITIKAALTALGSTDTAIACSVENLVQARIVLPGLHQSQQNIIATSDFVGLLIDQPVIDNAATAHLLMRFEGSYLFRINVDELPLPDPFKNIFDFVEKQRNGPDPVATVKGRLKSSIDIFQKTGGGDDVTWKAVLQCLFEDFEAGLNLNDLLQFFSHGLSVPVEHDAKEILLSALEFGCQLKMAELSLTNKKQGQGTGGSPIHITFRLNAELRFIDTLIPLYIEISDTNVAIGLDEVHLPLEISLPPVDDKLFDYTSGDTHTWYVNKLSFLEAQAQNATGVKQKRRFALQKAIVEFTKVICDQIPEHKGNYLRWLNVLAKQYSLLHHWVDTGAGEPEFKLKGLPYVKLDKLISGDVKNCMALDTTAVLALRGIRLEVDPKDLRKSSMSGSIKFAQFAKDNLLRTLEVIEWQFGLTADLIYFSLKTPGKVYFPEIGELQGVPIREVLIPPFESLTPEQQIEKDKKGYIRIDKAMLGLGYTKRSLAVQFQGECRLPEQLLDVLEGFQRGNTQDVFYASPPRKTSLYFRFEFIPIAVAQVIIVIPYFEFALDLRSEVSPGLVSARECKPFWDGIQLHLKNVFEADCKHIGFSPIFLGDIAPVIPYSFDIHVGNEDFGFTYIVDNYFYCYGKFIPYGIVPYPFLYDPAIPWVDNICVNYRFAGFGVNFNFQRPLPSFGLDGLLEVLALLSDSKYKIQPNGTLANSLRIALTDIYIKIPDYAKPFLPKAAEQLTKPVDLVLNVATFQHLFVDLNEQFQKIRNAIPGFVDVTGSRAEIIEKSRQKISRQVEEIAGSLTVDKIREKVASLFKSLPIETRIFSTEVNLGGFIAGATIAIISNDEIGALLTGDPAPARQSLGIEINDSLESIAGVLKAVDKESFSFADPGLPTTGINMTYSSPYEQKDQLISGGLKYLTKETLAPLSGILSGGGNGVLIGTDVKVFGQQVFNFVGFIGELRINDQSLSRGFVLYSQLQDPSLSVSVLHITVPIPLQINGYLQLSYFTGEQLCKNLAADIGDHLRKGNWATNDADVNNVCKTLLTGSGLLEAAFKATWYAVPDMLTVYLGQAIPPATTFGTYIIYHVIDLPKFSNTDELHWNAQKNKFFTKGKRPSAVEPKQLVAGIKAVWNKEKEAGEYEIMHDFAGHLFEAAGKSYARKKATSIAWDPKNKEFVLENDNKVGRIKPEDFATVLNLASTARVASKDDTSLKEGSKSKPDIIPGNDFLREGKINTNKASRCKITIDAQGRFVLSGTGGILFYPRVTGLKAELKCQSFLIVNHHCTASGNFELLYEFPLPLRNIFSANINVKGICTGKIGPQDYFDFTATVDSTFSLLGLALRGSFSVSNNGLSVHCSMAATGNRMINVYGFEIQFELVEGQCVIDCKTGFALELWGNMNAVITSYKDILLGLRVAGTGRIRISTKGDLDLETSGRLIWQNEEWLHAALNINKERISISGSVLFAAEQDLTIDGNTLRFFLESHVSVNVGFDLEDRLSILSGSVKGLVRLGFNINGQSFPLVAVNMEVNDLRAVQSHRGFKLMSLPQGIRTINPTPDLTTINPGTALSVTIGLPNPLGWFAGQTSSASPQLPDLDLSAIVDNFFPQLNKATSIWLIWKGAYFEMEMLAED